MYFYVGLIAVCFILGSFSVLLNKKKSINKYLLFTLDFLPYFILIMVTGFRYKVGTDYKAYENYFNLIKNGHFPRVEASFIFISKIGQFLNFNQQFMFLIYAAILYIFIYLGVRYFDPDYKYRHLILLLGTFYLLINGFNTIRQMASVGVLFFSLKYINEKKLKKFLVLVLLAFFLHKSAVIFVLLYFLLKIDSKKIFFFVLISPLFMFFDINILLKMFINLTHSTWYEYYLTFLNNKVDVSGSLILWIYYIIAIILSLSSHKINFSQRERIIINLFLWYIILMFTTSTSEVLTRIVYFAMPSIFIVIPILTKYFENFQFKRSVFYSKVLVTLFGIILWVYFIRINTPLFKEDGILKYTFKIFLN
jgi:transmembrane protein EpsG